MPPAGMIQTTKLDTILFYKCFRTNFRWYTIVLNDGRNISVNVHVNPANDLDGGRAYPSIMKYCH